MAALIGGLAGCFPAREVGESPHRSTPTSREPEALEAQGRDDDGAAVMLVVLDGTRWQEVFVGADPQLSATAGVPVSSAEALMPHLHALVADRGAALGAPGHGPAISASGPNFVSLPGYTEIFGGRRVHECANNDCEPTRTPTVMDQARAVWRRTGDVAVFSSWQKIERAASVDPGSLVLSSGRDMAFHADVLRVDDVTRHWLEEGARADAFPGYNDYRPDRFTAALALRYLEVERPRLMFLGLGDPDEYGHRDDYAAYLASLRAADATLGELFDVLRRMGTRGAHTTVIVTADHGRGRDYRVHGRAFPESGRVWLVAAGAGIEARGFAQALRPHRLADVAPTVRTLLQLPADVAPEAGAPLDELFMSPPLRSAMQP